MEQKRYRVAQWITGYTGLGQLRAIIQHPQLELVGVHVHYDHKVGIDAGDLVGLPKTGIKTTQNIEDILDAKPDCVVYSPMLGTASIEELCLFLEAGINITTIYTSVSLQCPDMLEQETRRRLEEACKKGNASILATGISPGFAQQNVVAALLAECRDIESLEIIEFGPLYHRLMRSPEMAARMCGMAPEVMEKNAATTAERRKNDFGQSFMELFKAVGLPIDELKSEVYFPTTREDLCFGNVVIPAGTVAAHQGTVFGYRNGRCLAKFSYNWYATENLDGSKVPFRDYGWRILIKGSTPFTLELYTDQDGSKLLTEQAYYNGNQAVNVIPFICESEPGILTIRNMSPILSQLNDYIES